jgi:hypothetical protein
VWRALGAAVATPVGPDSDPMLHAPATPDAILRALGGLAAFEDAPTAGVQPGEHRGSGSAGPPVLPPEGAAEGRRRGAS